MPVSIVVGGQFGSEGKGKVALELARRSQETDVTLVRVGGPNSGHTGYDKQGKRFALRQLPAGCIDRNVDVVFPAGSYLDLDVLRKEIKALDYPEDRIFISENAQIITEEHKLWEANADLIGAIGSTGSGVGAAVMARVARGASNIALHAIPALEAKSWENMPATVCDTTELLRAKADRGDRIIVEGSQGFGLSLLDGGYWPKATARTTTAAGALAETGLSPLDVDDVTLVTRSFPIRVAGESGPLKNEISWDEVANVTGRSEDLREYTTVTKNLRRVGKFDSEVVKRAIQSNRPTRLVMNHLDYVGLPEDLTDPSSQLSRFVAQVETDLSRTVDWLGFSVFGVLENLNSQTYDLPNARSE
ncbi:adenylosuccinate synthetase [Maritimibacter sp. 55A14]|uniref:adenylosuccinate synthetase n=1 Tax=Maritimibacter sp. 55A14 TaxID=2174844 RepID=UPI000D60352E|nr:adenylosuccinate synthetase [Maritimibacter sp. 55A14]PWE33419.1 adenylosuccinate synthetase [Maritimibacter sp. 55A14]